MGQLRRILFLLAPLLLALVIFGYCQGYKKTRSQTIVYTASGAETVTVEADLPWHQRRDGTTLHLDLYRPPADSAPSVAPLPAVVVVHGDGPESIIEDFKEWGQVTSWAHNIAAYGVAAVTFDHSSTEMLKDPHTFAEEVDTLLRYLHREGTDLGIDGQRLCLFTLSSAAPFALRTVFKEKPDYLRCIAIFYGAVSLEAFPGDAADRAPAQARAEFDLVHYLNDRPERVPPLFVAWGAKDFETLNGPLTHFAERAEALGIPVEQHSHPEGDHAFDLGSDDLESRRILQGALEFFATHLQTPDQQEEGEPSEPQEENRLKDAEDGPEDLAEETPGGQ